MKDSFIFYRSFYEALQEVDDNTQLNVIKAIIELALNQKETELSGISKALFTLIKPQVIANNIRYENGKKGGAPKGNQNAIKKQPKNNLKTTKQQPNVNVNENENENVNENIYKNKEYFKDKNLNNLFKEFLKIRTKLKAVNSELAIKKLLNKLNEYDDEEKYEVIEQSIVHSWKDIYPLKDKKPKWFDKETTTKELTDSEKEDLRWLDEIS